MRFVKSIKTNRTKAKSKDSVVIVVLAILLASIASVMVASTIAVVQEVEAKDRNPVKDSKMQRDAQTKLDGGSAYKQQKKGNDIDPEDGDPYIPLELPPSLPPPPSQGCFNDPKNC
jgi:mannitol-specific phosphotransferase system IIBC component